MDSRGKTAWVGIDVAIAKGKALPLCVCVLNQEGLEPLPLSEVNVPYPIGSGNPSMLDSAAVHAFASHTREYLAAIEDHYQVEIAAIAIDAPREPATHGRRACERGLDKLKISCYPTPSAENFVTIIEKGRRHLANGGMPAKLPHGFQLWMLAGFELFRVLGERWECLEVYPQAIIRQLGATHQHKSKEEGYQDQISRIAMVTSWSMSELQSLLDRGVRGAKHDKLDAFMAAWVAHLYPNNVVACGEPPTDVIWLPEKRDAAVRELGSVVDDYSDFAAPVSDGFRSGSTKTTAIGYTNRNSQICRGTRGLAGTDHGQVSYKLECGHCREVYGANGTEVFQRKCPLCQGGAPGIPY